MNATSQKCLERGLDSLEDVMMIGSDKGEEGGSGVYRERGGLLLEGPAEDERQGEWGMDMGLKCVLKLDTGTERQE